MPLNKQTLYYNFSFTPNKNSNCIKIDKCMLQIEYRFFLLSVTFFLFIGTLYAQEDSLGGKMLESSIQNILKLPVKGLGGVEIVSASKKSEKIFDAPLAATVVTKEEIKASGATSLIEVMRIIPGIMVREVANGNYEIHLRGLEYIPPYARLNQNANRTTLVMIDGRPVYNHLSGGIFWETLPIDINDVERIEVIRGPSAPLYGANAVSGVIHFITRKKNSSKAFDVVSNLQYGSFNTVIANSSVAYKVNEKLDIGFSGNYQHRDRTDRQYYSRTQNKYVDRAKLNFGAFNPDFIYPDTNLSLEKYALNAYLNYRPKSNIDINFRVGRQGSRGSKIYGENGASNLNYTESETSFIDVSAQIGKFKGQYNYWWGVTDERTSQAAYNFGVQEANLEYNFEKVSNLRITPFLSLRKVAYEEIKDGKRSILFSADGVAKGDNYGGGVNLDYLLLKKIRLILAVRAEHFEISKTNYVSYQSIATYKPNDKLIFRLVYGRSNAGTFIYDTYLSFSRTTPSSVPNVPSLKIEVLGNKDLKLLTQDIFEVGTRMRIGDALSIDIEAFSSTTKNIAATITKAPLFQPPLLIQQSKYEDTDIQIKQLGTTISVEVLLPKLSFKPFITLQKSNLINFSPFYVTPEVNKLKNINTTIDTAHVATPSYFGGFTLNYQLSKKINVYLNPYIFGQSTYFYLKGIRNPNEPQYLADIPAQMLLNIKASYQIDKRLNLFVNIRNLFSNNNYQHFHTDRMQPLYLLGFNFEM